MSIEKYGDKFRVRWYEGGRHPSRTFEKKGDAEAFDLDVRRRRQLGPLAPGVLQSRMTLGQFVSEEWWPRYAIPNLKPSTQRRYLEVWGSYLLPRLGGHQLREISPMMVEDLRAQLARQGLGPASQRKAIMLLQGIMRRAVVRGYIPSNPVSEIDKPKAPPTARPQPLSPATVEAVRALLRPRDATLVSVLAYAGLRPEEATRLTWGDLGDRTVFVAAGKTGRGRTVDVLAPLVQDLAEWRMLSGRPDDRRLIFPVSGRNGEAWQLWHWQNWRRRTYQPAAKEAGVTGDMRVYRLRGSFISLLLWAGEDLVYVSEQAGHSIATLARHYAGVMSDMRSMPRVPAAEAIRQAREVPQEKRRAL